MELVGYCRFCGQLQRITPDRYDNPEEMDEEALIERATMTCGCEGAVAYRVQATRKKKALKNITALFGDDAPKGKQLQPQVVDLLKTAADLLCNGKMEKMTVNLWGGIKATLSQNSKGEIKVERKETEKMQLSE